jgi:2-dehydro-3-deoxyglucarate aldolase
MKANRVKQLLRQGKPSIGTWVTIGHPEITEILSGFGFDWILFDTEHAPLDSETVQAMMQGMSASETLPLVRLARNDPVLINKALDIGGAGVVIPLVNSREDALNAVRACRYPPEGSRGVGPRRVVHYGADKEFYEYFKKANSEILVIPMLETETAIDHADEILSVDGVDGFFIGPTDLSTSLGIMGQWNDPKLEAAIQKALQAGKRAKVAPGIVGLGLEDAKKRLSQGFQFVSVGSDLSFLCEGAQACIEQMRAYLTK